MRLQQIFVEPLGNDPRSKNFQSSAYTVFAIVPICRINSNLLATKVYHNNQHVVVMRQDVASLSVNRVTRIVFLSRWKDLDLRHPGPKPGTLPTELHLEFNILTNIVFFT